MKIINLIKRAQKIKIKNLKFHFIFDFFKFAYYKNKFYCFLLLYIYISNNFVIKKHKDGK